MRVPGNADKKGRMLTKNAVRKFTEKGNSKADPSGFPKGREYGRSL